MAADFRRDGVRSSLVWDVLRDVVSARVAETGRQALDIVDVGGGTGGLAVPFAALGHNVTVVDPSPDALAAAQRRAAEAGARLIAVQGEAASLDSVVGAKAADLVICHNVLEYVEEPADAMTAIAAVLRPSATVSVLASNAVAAVLHRALAGRFTEARQLLESDGSRRIAAAIHPAGPHRAARGSRAARGGGARPADLQRAGARRAARRGRGRGRRDRGAARAGGGRRGHPAAARHRRAAAPARPPLTIMADDTGCHILHVDMDAFYASVEIRDRPELAGQPVIVGGTSGRGVVLSASYQARAFGVRSAMPVGRAQRMCPRAVFVAPRHRTYAATSKEVMAIFGTVTPDVEPLALDEAFLDVSGALRRLGPPAVIARHIRAEVARQQGITCSVGVAPTKFVAKIASARCKPDGLLVVPRAGVLDFLHALPVSALWGVGERTGEVLARLGLRTVGDIAHTPLATLQHELGAAQGSHLAALAWGRDERRVTPHVPEKSIGAEETFATDIDDPERIRRELLKLSGRTAHSLRAGGYAARTVSVKLRLASFKTMTRSRTLAYPTDVAREIYATACALYESAGLDEGARLRLVGVRVSGLVIAAAANAQLTFDDRPVGWREAERAVDAIATRFGASAVRPAALVQDTNSPAEGGF